MGHLAYTLADSIYKMQRHELDITRSDVKCAEIAGANLVSQNFFTSCLHVKERACKDRQTASFPRDRAEISLHTEQ